MLIVLGALILVAIQITIVGGITAGIVLAVNALAGTDFSLIVPLSIVCGIYLLAYVGQALVVAGVKRKAYKSFDSFGGRRL